MKRILFTAAFFLSVTKAGASNVEERIGLDALAVDYASSDVFHADLILSSAQAVVTVHCKDRISLLQSTIQILFVNPDKSIEKRTFAGTDFYCYGARALSESLLAGNLVNLNLLIVSNGKNSRLSEGTVSLSDGSKINKFNIKTNSSTHWSEQ